jgi:hypothetical protein
MPLTAYAVIDLPSKLEMRQIDDDDDDDDDNNNNNNSSSLRTQQFETQRNAG